MITLTGFADEISSDLEEQLDVLESEGIYHLELRSVWGKNVLKLSNEETVKVKERLDQRGFRVSSIGSPIGKIKITDAFEPHLEEAKHAIQLAKFFAARYVRIFSFYIPDGNPADYRAEVLGRMERLTRLAESEGVILLHENESHIYGDTGERCLDILQANASAHLRAAFDPANFVQCKVEPVTQAYPLLSEYISYIHIKDALMENDKVVPAGEGDGQLCQLIHKLNERGYSGFLSLEPHLKAEGKWQGFDKPELFVVAAKALKQLLAENNITWS
ncbi:sugar phosphate isomerase/epimerase family protein [Paenibacillus sp. OAS669]|uniref:sugar phosphate isomerase/epimerase family protein n=1 Tax=Paenibacillus sp. OAS669 TaxID=2663821 RepID=UPI001788FFE4|nr:sugar phosphate isomerase/epimerase family protein [Paenibacillus sp. OAS669]MBE1440602.1 sugar phosphate isomerase/epimerase [Paenibacillus sp. OAS669]